MKIAWAPFDPRTSECSASWSNSRPCDRPRGPGRDQSSKLSLISQGTRLLTLLILKAASQTWAGSRNSTTFDESGKIYFRQCLNPWCLLKLGLTDFDAIFVPFEITKCHRADLGRLKCLLDLIQQLQSCNWFRSSWESAWTSQKPLLSPIPKHCLGLLGWINKLSTARGGTITKLNGS